MLSPVIQVYDLLLIQLTSFRWSWRRTMILGAIVPILSILIFSQFINEEQNELLGYVFVGNLVLSILFETIGKVSSRFAYMRASGMLDYLATLPIERTALILATVLAFFILSLPGFMMTVIIGKFILQIPLSINISIIFILPLISISLCGLGALIGLLGRNPEEVGSISTLTTFILYVMGPILIPTKTLPPLFSTISLLSPTTYAASALRQVMLNQTDNIPLYIDIVVLVFITFVLLKLVSKHIDWRPV